MSDANALTDTAVGDAPPSPPDKDNWKYRRRAVVWCLAFFSGLIGGLMVWGDTKNDLHELALEGSIWAINGIMLTYIGGAVADYGLQAWASRGKRGQ